MVEKGNTNTTYPVQLSNSTHKGESGRNAKQEYIIQITAFRYLSASPKQCLLHQYTRKLKSTDWRGWNAEPLLPQLPIQLQHSLRNNRSESNCQQETKGVSRERHTHTHKKKKKKKSQCSLSRHQFVLITINTKDLYN